MIKKQTKNNTTAPLGLEKPQNWMDSIISQSFMHYPDKEAWRKRLIFSLFEWLKDPDNIMIEDFCYEYKLPVATFYEWRTKYPDIKQASIEVKRFLGARRRKGAIQGRYNFAAAFRDMHCYDPNWGKEVDKYHADLKNDTEKNEGTKFVVVERYTPLENANE